MSGSVEFDLSKRNVPESKKRAVFVTGAAGRIGSLFAQSVSERYDLTLMIRPCHAEGKLTALGKVVRANLEQPEKLVRLLQGIDTVVHLAANPNQNASWDELIGSNIIGLYNIFTAAKEAGCRRVVFASSIHVVSGYPLDYQVHPDDPVNPADLYGVSKCFGEAMARYMSSIHKLSSVCIRIGSFQSAGNFPKNSSRIKRTFISRRDLSQLLVRCIDNEDIRFAIVHGLSNNCNLNRLDIGTAREFFGYVPQDGIEECCEE